MLKLLTFHCFRRIAAEWFVSSSELSTGKMHFHVYVCIKTVLNNVIEDHRKCLEGKRPERFVIMKNWKHCDLCL